MPKTQGIIRGRTIELAEDLGVADGQQVEVQVTVVGAPMPRADISRTAGALADDDEWDAIMDEVHQARKIDRPTSPDGQ